MALTSAKLLIYDETGSETYDLASSETTIPTYSFKPRLNAKLIATYYSDAAKTIKIRVVSDPGFDRYYDIDVKAGSNTIELNFYTANLFPEAKKYAFSVAAYTPTFEKPFFAAYFVSSEIPPSPPNIVVNAIEVAPSPALTTETVEVVGFFENKGTEGGNATVTTVVKKNEEVVRSTSKTIYVGGLSSKVDYTDTFTLPAGSYTITVTVVETGSSKSTTLVVEEELEPRPVFQIVDGVKQAWFEYDDVKAYENQTLNVPEGKKVYAKAVIVNMGKKGQVSFWVYDVRKQDYIAGASVILDKGYAWNASLSVPVKDGEYELYAAYTGVDGNAYVSDKAGC